MLRDRAARARRLAQTPRDLAPDVPDVRRILADHRPDGSRGLAARRGGRDQLSLLGREVPRDPVGDPMVAEQRRHVQGRERGRRRDPSRDREIVPGGKVLGADRLGRQHRVGRSVDAVIGRAADRRKVKGTQGDQLAAVAVSHDPAQTAQPARGRDYPAVIGKRELGVRPALPSRARGEQLAERRGTLVRDDDRVTGEAVAAVKIATEHAEGEGFRTREGVEERLLFHGVELERPHVAVGDAQGAGVVEADAADTVVARRDEAAVAAGEAAHAILGQLLVEDAFPGVTGQELAQGGGSGRHGGSLPH